MKVLDLRCAHDHRFEGWFASAEEFEQQLARGLVECPVCGDTAIARLPNATRLNVSTTRRDPVPAPVVGPADAQRQTLERQQQQAQAIFLGAVRRMLATTEDVGDRFPEEARRIHYGESPERGIRGRATPQDAQALRDEGIEVLSLQIPEALKGPVQ